MHGTIPTGFYMLIFVVFAVILSGLIIFVCKVLNDRDNGYKSERRKEYEPSKNTKR